MHSHSYGIRKRAQSGLRAAVVIIFILHRHYPTSAQVACYPQTNFFVSRQLKRTENIIDWLNRSSLIFHDQLCELPYQSNVIFMDGISRQMLEGKLYFRYPAVILSY
jgi:hypothetical protein